MFSIRMTKSIIVVFLYVALLSATFAEGIDKIIPDDSLWGISRNDLKDVVPYKFIESKIGNANCLKASNIVIGNYTMDVYYVFKEKMWNSEGWTFKGLSKIAYILSENTDNPSVNLTDCKNQLVEMMTNVLGDADSISKAVTTWENNTYKVEIGKGIFKKYNGSDQITVAILISGLNIKKPSTPEPTTKPTKTPYPTITKTPHPTLSTRLWYNNENSDGSISFDTSIVDNANYSISEWVSSDYNRSVLTVLLNAIVISDGYTIKKTTSYPLSSSFVGRTEDSIYIISLIDDGVLQIHYWPDEHEGRYKILPVEDVNNLIYLYEYSANAHLAEKCEYGYYKNDNNTILSCIYQFSK